MNMIFVLSCEQMSQKVVRWKWPTLSKGVSLVNISLILLNEARKDLSRIQRKQSQEPWPGMKRIGLNQGAMAYDIY